MGKKEDGIRFLKVFVERFQKIREEKGMIQTDFRKILGISQRAISNIENLKRQVLVNEAKSLADALKVSPSWLTFGQGPQDPDQADRWEQLLGAVEGVEPVLIAMADLPPEDRDLVREFMAALGKMTARMRPESKGSGQPVENKDKEEEEEGQGEEGTGAAREGTGKAMGRESWPGPIPKTMGLLKYHHHYREASETVERIPTWTNVACGLGVDEGLQEVRADIVIEELPHIRGYHAVRAKGDSMVPVINPGVWVILQEINGRDGFLLPADPEQKRSMEFVISSVPAGPIYLLEFEPHSGMKSFTLKFIRYLDRKGGKWDLEIFGTEEINPIRVTEKDGVRFWAKVIGISEERIP